MFKPHMGLILDHSIIILMELAIHSREILNEYSSSLHTENSYYLLNQNQNQFGTVASEIYLKKQHWSNLQVFYTLCFLSFLSL